MIVQYKAVIPTNLINVWQNQDSEKNIKKYIRVHYSELRGELAQMMN